MTGNRSKRTVLYLTPVAVERLEAVAAERTEAAGVEVTPEGAARALLYAGLKLAPDGARARSGEDVGALSGAIGRLEVVARALATKSSMAGKDCADLGNALQLLASEMRTAMGLEDDR